MKRVIILLFVTGALAAGACADDEPCDTGREAVLDSLEDALARREAAVAARERALGMRAGGGSDGYTSGDYNTGDNYSGTDGSSRTSPASVVVNDSRGRRSARRPTEVRTAYRKSNSAFPGQYPESSERLLTTDDLAHISPFGKKVMLNEIYARHGMIFTDPEMKRHFAQESWYRGTRKSVDGRLTAIERQNIAFLNAN